MSRFSCPYLLPLLALFSLCGKEPVGPWVDTDTDTGPSDVAGFVAYEDGTPAADISVYLRPRDFLPSSDNAKSKRAAFALTMDSTSSDPSGHYLFSEVDSGLYVVEARDTTNKGAFVDSISVSGKDSILMAPTATLAAVGAIQGAIPAGVDPQNVQVQVYGLNRTVTPDSSGNYSIGSIPQGNYRVVISYNVDDTPKQEVVSAMVAPGDTTSPDTSSPDSTVPDTTNRKERLPAPENLNLTYDTLNGHVHLSWDAIKDSSLAGYRIARVMVGGIIADIGGGGKFLTATNFTDTLYFGKSDTSSQIYLYQVYGTDRAGAGGLMASTENLTVIPPSRVRTTIEWATTSTKISIYKPASFAINFHNPRRTIEQIEWSVVPPDSILRSTQPMASNGADGISFQPAEPGSLTLRVRLVDHVGDAWFDSLRAIALSNIPFIDAGPNQTVTVNDSFQVKATATSLNGSIVKYRFDFGDDGTYEDSAANSGSFITQAPALPNTYPVAVQAEDALGATAKDTMLLQVLLDQPAAYGGPDITLSVGDSFQITGQGFDSLGSIVMYRFDLQGNGIFTDSSSTNRVKTGIAPHTAGIYHLLFAVEDDDGNVAVDTVDLIVLQDMPIARAGRDTIVSINDSFTVHGSGTDGYGTLVYRLDVNTDGSLEDSSSNSGTFHAKAPSTPGVLPVALIVEDDDGNRVADTMEVTVLQCRPTAVITVDSIFNYDDTVSLQAGLSWDSLGGTIVSYQWDLDGPGPSSYSAPSTSPTRSFLQTDKDREIWLKITDDDGNFALDTVRIRTRPRPVTIDTIVMEGDSAGNRWATVSWTSSPDNDFKEYRLYHALLFGGDTSASFQTVSARQDTTRTISGLGKLKLYRFWITVFDTTGLESPTGDSVEDTTLAMNRLDRRKGCERYGGRIRLAQTSPWAIQEIFNAACSRTAAWKKPESVTRNLGYRPLARKDESNRALALHEYFANAISPRTDREKGGFQFA